MGNKGDSDGMGEDDELPHARGPEEIGMEDMGPQGGSGTERSGSAVSMGVGMQGIDVEAAVGRRLAPAPTSTEDETKEEAEKPETPTTPKREAEDELSGEGKKFKSDSAPDSEPKTEEMDIELVDVDGKASDEAKVGEEGDTKGADVVDTTSV
jgi:hypothetical protein